MTLSLGLSNIRLGGSVSGAGVGDPIAVAGADGAARVTYLTDPLTGITIDGVTYTQDVEGRPITQANLAGGMILAAPVLVGDGTPDVGETLTITPPVVAGLTIADLAFTYSTSGVTQIKISP